MNGQLEDSSPFLQNNHAVVQMREANYDRAVQVLRGTLAALSAFMRNSFDDSEDFTEDDSFVPLDLSKSGVRFSSCNSAMTLPPYECEQLPKHFVPSPLEATNDLPLNTRTGEVLSYIVMYNLALTWHLWGLSTSKVEDKEAFLLKALNLYRLAHEVISGGRMNVGLCHYMTLVCNTGHIHFCLGSEEKANACFQLLLQSLMFVVDQGSQCVCEFFDGFICNIVPLVLEERGAAAA
ncbi:hypothetical protein IV203_009221 [Nitzschia inconspicua]|uniref:Uncharacterized protein n=1 Tax=Nitzschia inconspicua TaxID=303405 RepID=A0A9K3PMS6_9STRA|nr:hypothetical protein IV203_009221 [Nitzschia inconspicua]